MRVPTLGEREEVGQNSGDQGLGDNMKGAEANVEGPEEGTYGWVESDELPGVSVEKYWRGDRCASAEAWAADKELRISDLKMILEEKRGERHAENFLLSTSEGDRSQRAGKGVGGGI